jgi:hypothetical protein
LDYRRNPSCVEGFDNWCEQGAGRAEQADPRPLAEGAHLLGSVVSKVVVNIHNKLAVGYTWASVAGLCHGHADDCTL